MFSHATGFGPRCPALDLLKADIYQGAREDLLRVWVDIGEETIRMRSRVCGFEKRLNARTSTLIGDLCAGASVTQCMYLQFNGSLTKSNIKYIIEKHTPWAF